MSRKLLVVEPYGEIRTLLEAALRRTGHEVVAVGSGAEAVEAMERERFACVIAGSPVVVESGLTEMLLVEYIEQRWQDERPCLIVVTTHVESETLVAACARLRVCAVLAKPFSPGDLLEILDGCLDGRHGATRWIGIPEASFDGIEES